MFPIRTCRRAIVPGKPTRPCVHYEIGQCLAPCAGKLSEDAYAQVVKNVVNFLNGHAEGVVREQLNEGHRFTHYAIPQGLYGAAEEDTAAPADVPANVSVNAPATALTHLDAALDALTQARQALLALQAALREASHAAG